MGGVKDTLRAGGDSARRVMWKSAQFGVSPFWFKMSPIQVYRIYDSANNNNNMLYFTHFVTLQTFYYLNTKKEGTGYLK